MTADQPARPANITNIVAINQGRRPLSLEARVSRPLPAATLASLQREGHLVIDTRRGAQFAAGHLPGSLNVQLASPEFEQRVGWVTPPEGDLVLVLDSDDQAAAAMKALAFVGLDARVAGHLDGGIDAWRAAGHAIDWLEEVDVHALSRRLAADDGLRVLDVRERSEWDAGHVPGSRQVSYKFLAQHAPEFVAAHPNEVLAVVCQSGGRSNTAASILRRAGVRDVLSLAGGLQAWVAAGFPVERAGAVCVPPDREPVKERAITLSPRT